MIYQNEKFRLFSHMIQFGTKLEDMDAAMLNNGIDVPQHIRERWKNRLKLEVSDMRFPENPRLVNKFTIGADPEFVFSDSDGDYIHAKNCRFTTLSAFGCDMSGRQAEIRAHPSRFVVEVVASMVDTLRWMASYSPEIKGYKWIAAPIKYNDGCGGHIAFGRKRPRRLQEIKSLDKITTLLVASGIWDREEVEDRRANTHYGRYNDYRTQTFGYEYRTMPTWLGSLWQAYFTLTVAKLAVYHNQDILLSPNSKQQLINLIGAYRGMDDDAEIAWNALALYGFPHSINDDFKQNWGINIREIKNISLANHFFPKTIPPSPETIREVFEYLVNGKMLPSREPKISWVPFKLPNGYHNIVIQQHVPSLIDIGAGLCSYGMHVDLNISSNCDFKIWTPYKIDEKRIKKYARYIVPKMRGKVLFDAVPGTNAYSFWFPKNTVVNRTSDLELCKQFRKLLLIPELFPICRGEDVGKINFLSSYAYKDSPIYVGKEILKVRGGE